MLENNRNSTALTGEKSAPASMESTGFRGFNATGREDVTTEVLRPQIDAATIQKRIVMIAILLVLASITGYIAYTRSHLTLTPNEGGRVFAPDQQHVD